MRPPGQEILRTIAFVLGDREMVTIDGRGTLPGGHDITAKVVAVASAMGLGLGSDRRRPYYYAAPAGWRRLSRFRADLWLAPGHPRDPATITVFHSRPLLDQGQLRLTAAIVEEMPVEFARRQTVREPLQTAAGLQGDLATFAAVIDGVPRQITNAALGDSVSLHFLRLESAVAHTAANLEAFRGVVASVGRVPVRHAATNVWSAWVD